MKTGLLYTFFVILTLGLVSSEQKDKEQVKVDLFTYQFITGNCIVPEVSFSKERNISELFFFRLIINKYFIDSYYQKSKLDAASIKFYLLKAIDLIPLKQNHFRQIIHYTSEKQDNSNLS